MITIKCTKGFFGPKTLGVMKGEIWQEVEWKKEQDAMSFIFECKEGINNGMALSFSEKQLVTYFELINF